MELEYIAQSADTGEFIPVLASDRYEALEKLSDVPIELLYMESQSPDSVFSSNAKYAYHLVRLKNGDYFVMEKDPRPIEKDDIDKVYVDVKLS